MQCVFSKNKENTHGLFISSVHSFSVCTLPLLVVPGMILTAFSPLQYIILPRIRLSCSCHVSFVSFNLEYFHSILYLLWHWHFVEYSISPFKQCDLSHFVISRFFMFRFNYAFPKRTLHRWCASSSSVTSGSSWCPSAPHWWCYFWAPCQDVQFLHCIVILSFAIIKRFLGKYFILASHQNFPLNACLKQSLLWWLQNQNFPSLSLLSHLSFRILLQAGLLFFLLSLSHMMWAFRFLFHTFIIYYCIVIVYMA